MLGECVHKALILGIEFITDSLLSTNDINGVHS